MKRLSLSLFLHVEIFLEINNSRVLNKDELLILLSAILYYLVIDDDAQIIKILHLLGLWCYMQHFNTLNCIVPLLFTMQCRSKLDNWGGGGGGAHIHIFVFTDHKNNRFKKKLIMQNTNI